MAENSKIEWTTHTFNPWRGCTKVSPGCAHCYADTLSKRNPLTLGVWGPNGTRVVAAESAWREPLKWDRAAKAEQDAWLAARGTYPRPDRPRVFCASLADVFEGPETMPAEGWKQVDECARYRLWATIWCTPHLDWLLLTKRPENISGPKHHIWAPGAVANATGWVRDIAGDDEARRFYSSSWPPPNVWLGTSVENQEAADTRIPHLLRAPAAVRFLSCEPLLGPVDLSKDETVQYCNACGETTAIDLNINNGDCANCGDCRTRERSYLETRMIDWVIVGGESGTGARPLHVEWVRSLRDQCVSASVPFFFKQWGEWLPASGPADAQGFTEWQDEIPDNLDRLRYHKHPDGYELMRLGKKAAGRLLDGREWNEYPVPAEARP